MPWVERKGGSIVTATYANRQPGFAEEFLSDDHADVVAYRTPKSAPSVLTAEALATKLVEIGGRALTQDDIDDAKQREQIRLGGAI